MTLLLRRHDLRRVHRPTTGELVLEYAGREPIAWTARVEGYPAGVLAVVSRSDVALPPTLEVCAADAQVELADHPMVPRLRSLVAEALLAAHRENAPALIEHLSGLEVTWAPGAAHSVSECARRARGTVDLTVNQLASDLAARARRRRASEIMNAKRSLPATPAAEAALAALQPAPPRPPTRAPVFTDEALESLARDVEQARKSDMPQRLPHGARRSLFRLAAGIYLCEDGLLSPYPTLREALEQAARIDSRSLDRAVIDWDGEWPVMVRRFGEGGFPGYRLDRAIQRYLTSPESSVAAP
ncbi:MAG TPA: hypothetical protein VIY27_10425 [Myxococcota bacterium]